MDVEELFNKFNNPLTNMGTARDVTIQELAEKVMGIVGFEGGVLSDISEPDGTPRKLLYISRIRRLGWQAKTSLEDGISKTFKWYLGAEV